MENDPKTELKELKRQFLEIERVHQEERECLVLVIQTLGTVVTMHEEMGEAYDSLKDVVNVEGSLPLELVEQEISKLKDKVITLEGEEPEGAESESLADLKERLVNACRNTKKIMVALLEDFYPLSNELQEKADAIDVDCSAEAAEIDLAGPTGSFLNYVDDLKSKILEDFRYINTTFLTLLEQVKELEKTFASEFGTEERLKEIEYFEMKVSTEVGSIVESFNIHNTIDEIKSTVLDKIENIKRIVSLRKKEETIQSLRAKENISRLKRRIVEVEKDALVMTQKAEKLQTAALNDGLTGLYNRKAFDIRVRDALGALTSRKIPFAVVLFDVDKFKGVNDTFGHVAGDTVLKKVAQCLKDTFRQDDFISRYGGDEFAVVIERLTKDMAKERIASFRKNLKKIRFKSYKKGEIDISVSSGIALANNEDTPETLIDRADKAMYASKEKSK